MPLAGSFSSGSIPRCIGALLLASAMVGAIACERNLNSPSAPSATDVFAKAAITPASAGPGSVLVGAMRQTKVSICHRTEGSDAFILITVAEPAVAAHLAHGDGTVGGPVPGQPGMKFSADCTPVPFVAVTIGFTGLSANGSPFTAYQESGFTVTAISGAWQVLATYGHPAPSIIFSRSAGQPTLTGEIQVTAGGSPFSFTSVDMYSSITPIPYDITGLLSGQPAFTLSGTVPNTFGNFATVPNTHAADLIDTLSIMLSNPATPCCSNPVGLDNIVVKH